MRTEATRNDGKSFTPEMNPKTLNSPFQTVDSDFGRQQHYLQ